MKNEITLQDGNKIIIEIHNGYCTDVIQISKGYFEEKRLKKQAKADIKAIILLLFIYVYPLKKQQKSAAF